MVILAVGAACLMLAPRGGARHAIRGKLKVVKMNVDENVNSPGQYNIRGSHLACVSRTVKSRTDVGAVPKDQIEKACSVTSALRQRNKRFLASASRAAALSLGQERSQWLATMTSSGECPLHDDRALFGISNPRRTPSGFELETVLRKRDALSEAV